jgi:hypothetical protein
MATLMVELDESNNRKITRVEVPQKFYTDPMTYAAIFGYGTNPGRPIPGSRLNFPLWGRQPATPGTEGIITIPRASDARVKVLAVYTPRQWLYLMNSEPSGPMKVVFPRSNTPPTHGCILEFI